MSAALDVAALGVSMIDAARDSVAERWPSIQSLAEGELRGLAQKLAQIETLLVNGEIDTNRAHKLVQIHQLAVRSVLCTVQGVGIRTAEEATRAAVVAASPIVNQIVGFKLL